MGILYSDDDIVAVDKPPGVAAHATVGWHGPTVLGGLAAARPEGLVLEFGVRFGTSIRQIAALAAQWLGVRQVVPMHWGTFPLLTGRPSALKTLLEPHNIDVVEMEPGETAR